MRFETQKASLELMEDEITFFSLATNKLLKLRHRDKGPARYLLTEYALNIEFWKDGNFNGWRCR